MRATHLAPCQQRRRPLNAPGRSNPQQRTHRTVGKKWHGFGRRVKTACSARPRRFQTGTGHGDKQRSRRRYHLGRYQRGVHKNRARHRCCMDRCFVEPAPTDRIFPTVGHALAVTSLPFPPVGTARLDFVMIRLDFNLFPVMIRTVKMSRRLVFSTQAPSPASPNLALKLASDIA